MPNQQTEYQPAFKKYLCQKRVDGRSSRQKILDNCLQQQAIPHQVYNLEAIIAVGYRVKFHRCTRFYR
ncbi:virulence RhuM family protein [Candidatus Methylobacter oryzae]|uniref:Virulence RhuM family protein n=1 Tax=Candidatus Methylobacter oryzae TaxID=2497749 RepID=A0ABY3CEV9_9GAMM|nr:virulence RhuM family protein [Candidatus Methylobacter oryzae]